MHKFFKSLVVLALPVTFLGLVAISVNAQETKPAKKVKQQSPVVTWNWERKSGEEKMSTKLTVAQKDGKFTGKVKDEDHDLAIKSCELKDGTFSFEVFPHPEKPDFSIKFSGKVSENQIKGTMNYFAEEEDKSIPWIAKRDDPNQAVLGKWLLEFETPDGAALSFTIEAKKKGKGIGLEFVDDDSAKFRKVKFKDGVLSFVTKQVYEDQPISVEWDLTIKGNQATGSLYYSFDNDAAEEGEIEVNGERVK